VSSFQEFGGYQGIAWRYLGWASGIIEPRSYKQQIHTEMRNLYQIHGEENSLSLVGVFFALFAYDSLN